MLTEERFAEILRMLGEEKSVTVQELTGETGNFRIDDPKRPGQHLRKRDYW